MLDKENQKLTKKEIFELLDIASYCRLSVSDNNQPYIVPMYFLWKYNDERLWFLLYSKDSGEKIRCLNSNPKVALEFETYMNNTLCTVVARGELTEFVEKSKDCPYGKDYIGLEILAHTISGKKIVPKTNNKEPSYDK